MHILHVVGARPNFMKAAPVIRALTDGTHHRQTLVHTGQHYDSNMSEVFFRQLGLADPDINLEVGSGTHAQQTAHVMLHLEPVIVQKKPDLVLVYGDVNSTLATALVCSKLQVPLGHVEAGLRSLDRSMPEEINRLLTDQVADLLFTHSQTASENLLREGVPSHKIHFVGNVMVDSLRRLLPVASKSDPAGKLGVGPHYGVVTLHRPSNVDPPHQLEYLIGALDEISHDLPLLFPVHPRTDRRIQEITLQSTSQLHIVKPLSYLDFLALESRATLAITDSGGVQEETTCLGVPCFTVRENTERPVTVTLGTNTLVGQDMRHLQSGVEDVLAGRGKRGQIPPLWDGNAAPRIARVIDQMSAPRHGKALPEFLYGTHRAVEPNTPYSHPANQPTHTMTPTFKPST